jgi:hypothetical protein
VFGWKVEGMQGHPIPAMGASCRSRNPVKTLQILSARNLGNLIGGVTVVSHEMHAPFFENVNQTWL